MIIDWRTPSYCGLAAGAGQPLTGARGRVDVASHPADQGDPMRVARLYAAGDLRLSDEPEPTVPPGHSLVQVTAVGICGSDLHWFDEGGIGDAGLDRPLVPGHEMAGVIAAGPRRGQRVAIDPALPCHACRSCRSGHPNLCPQVRFAGHGSVDGGLREYLAWPDAALHPLPDSLSDVDGAMLEPFGVALHSLDLAHLRVGASAAVIGCGPIGLLTIQLVSAAGADTVYAADPLAHRQQAATALGASTGDSPADEVDVVFEISGTDQGLATALRLVRPGGRVLLVGIPSDDVHTLPAGPARRKGVTIAMVRRMGEVYPRAIAMSARPAIDLTSIVTDQFGLDEAAAAFRYASSRAGLKTVINCTSRA
jgi:L-iditol 2-dehydrogenase